nr:hypothetical protein [Tanacetum cinerariifolium]
MMKFILDQEEKVKQLEEYMGVIGSDFMQLSLEVIVKLKEEIRMEENRVKKIEKITRYRNIEDLEPLNGHKFSKALTEKGSFHTPKFVSNSLSNTSAQSSLVHLFSKEIPGVNEPDPQLLLNFSSLNVNLGDKRGIDPPIKPHSQDSFKMKVVDKSTINTPPSPHVISFHPKDTYCYYHPCIDNTKKNYGFKPCLLGQCGSLCVDFSNIEMIKNDWELESKEASFLGRGLNSPIRPKEVEKVTFDEKKLGSS